MGQPAAVVDVICYSRPAGSRRPRVTTLASDVKLSRVQELLPSNVPMSLRLVARPDESQSGATPSSSSSTAWSSSKRSSSNVRAQSESLLWMMSDSGEALRPTWEVWSRNEPTGQLGRWVTLPERLQGVFEASWLEGQTRHSFTIAAERRDSTDDEGSEEYEVIDDDEPTSMLDAGKYEIVFGDECSTQHTVRRLALGVVAWTANARRVVLDADGEDAAPAPVATDDLCIICMERRKSHAFMHADTGDGHLAICGSCAENYNGLQARSGRGGGGLNCPVCRRAYSSLQRIYS